MLSVGDIGTIRRGKYRGKAASVATQPFNGRVALRIQDEEGKPSVLEVLDETSFEKAPEPTVELRAVSEAIEKVRGRYDGESSAALDELRSELGLELGLEN